MEPIEAGRIKATEAMKRYGIKSRGTWGNWLERAGVESFKDGRESYIYESDLPKLDAIAQEMNRPIHPPTEQIEHVQPMRSPTEQIGLIQIPVRDYLELIAQLAIKPHPIEDDPDSNLLRLDRFARKGWLLKSKELKELLGRKSLPSCHFYERGFFFCRKGREWRVKKEP